MTNPLPIDRVEELADELTALNAQISAAVAAGNSTLAATLRTARSARITALFTAHHPALDVAGLNVRTYGAKGDGATDDTAAIQAAINAAPGDVVFPPGVYRCASGLSIPNGVRLRGLCQPGAANANANLVTLRHDFSGTFITFDGSAGANRGAGGGLRDLIVEQYHGDGTSHSGTAVLVTGSTTALRANWVRIENCQIENASGKNKWTWGVDYDGSPVGGSDGVRDMWLIGGRIVADAAGGAVRWKNVFNAWAIGVETNLTGSDFVITGAAGAVSSSVFLIGCSAANLEIDYATYVFANGGAYTTVSTTANTTKARLDLSFLSSMPTSLLGTDVTVSAYVEALGRHTCRSTTQTATIIGRDDGAGDSTNTTQFVVGNTGSNEGDLKLQYTNAAAAGGPTAAVRFQPRNNADSSNFDGGRLEFGKVGGSDQVQAILYWRGSGGEHSVTFHQNGTAIFGVPVRLPVYTDATRPSAGTVGQGSTIWNSGDNAPNFSDGTNWRDAAGVVT